MKRKIVSCSLCVLMALLLAVTVLPTVNAWAAKENFAVGSVAISGIETPLAGAKPDYTPKIADGASYALAENGVQWEEYDSDWEWQSTLHANSIFKKDHWYVVMVTVDVKSGFFFSDSVSGTINGAAAQTNGKPTSSRASFYVSFQCTETAITKVDLSVIAPAVGKFPTFAKVNTDQYESKNTDPKLSNQTNGVVWTNMSSGVNLTVSNVFKENISYSVSYTLYPKSGYQFSENLAVTVNGQKALVRFEDGYITVRLENMVATYKTIPSVTITGVTAPVAGKTPSYDVVATGTHCAVQGQNDDRWVNGVSWAEFEPGAFYGITMKKTDVFKPGYTYKVYIDVVPTDPAYAFVQDQSVATVNGMSAYVVVADRNARVIYSFDTPAEQTISKVELNVTAPAAGAKPAFDKIDGTGYYSENDSNAMAAYKNGIAWFETADPYIAAQTFEAGKSYTLRICLSPKAGYNFNKSLTATVNGKTAAVTAYDDGTVLLEVALTVPTAPHTHTPSAWQTDDGSHWKICTDPECGSVVTARQLHTNTDADGKCDICGYQLHVQDPEDPDAPTVPLDPSGPSDPEDPDAPTDPTEPGGPANPTAPADPTDPGNPDDPNDPPKDYTIWIVAALVVPVAGGAGIVLLLKKKK